MRGEQKYESHVLPRLEGSPPHARGAGIAVHQLHGHFGITPACAGSRVMVCTGSVIVWDHPRMRGEQSVKLGLRGGRSGSPPHARGADSTSYITPGIDGITPACAGSSASFVE